MRAQHIRDPARDRPIELHPSPHHKVGDLLRADRADGPLGLVGQCLVGCVAESLGRDGQPDQDNRGRSPALDIPRTHRRPHELIVGEVQLDAAT
jgi:hypothetical protein